MSKRNVTRIPRPIKPKAPDFLKSEIAQSALKALFADIAASFDEFVTHIEAALPGNDMALQRASVLFQMNESTMKARQAAIVSAAGLALEEKRLENDHAVNVAGLGDSN
ncbi:MAG: hypothetical protein GWN87_18810 [Desulfuromonadales bacterium]|nr:hypothetical protein [Desulfuromonadales bacterium]